MSDGTFPVRLGDRVNTGFGSGVVTDRESYAGEALVLLDSGTVFDMTHGRWIPMAELTVTGFDPDVLVWYAGRRVRASELSSDKYAS